MHQEIEILNQKIKYIWEDETVFDISIDEYTFSEIEAELKGNYLTEGEFMQFEDNTNCGYRGFWQVAIPTLKRPEFNFRLSKNQNHRIFVTITDADIMLPVKPGADLIIPVQAPQSEWVEDFEDTPQGRKQRLRERKRILNDRAQTLKEFEAISWEWPIESYYAAMKAEHQSRC